MYTSTILFAIVASFASFVVATPPGCLIAAVEMQADPSDMKSLCGSLESAMVGNITEACHGANEQAAISIYSASCLAQGVTISITSSAPPSAKTGSSNAATTTAADGAVITPSLTGSGSPSSTSKAAGAAITPHNALLIAPIFFGAGLAGQYLL